MSGFRRTRWQGGIINKTVAGLSLNMNPEACFSSYAFCRLSLTPETYNPDTQLLGENQAGEFSNQPPIKIMPSRHISP